MKRFMVAGGLMLATFAGVTLADEKALKELEGTYTVVSLEKAGKTAAKSLTDTMKFTIKGDDLLIAFEKDGEKQEKKAKLKADNSKAPFTIDLRPIDGDAKGKVFAGIYKLEKGEVTLLFVESADRPKEFKAEGDAMLVKMKKEK